MCAFMIDRRAVLVRAATQEAARAKEQGKIDREAKKAEKAEKAENKRVARVLACRERQATTKKRKRGGSTAGTPLAQLVWQEPEPVPVELAPM